MAYETKGLLIGICDYIRAVKDDPNAVEMIYEHIRKIANADSANVGPITEAV